jgi:hypothetical protein
VGPPVAPEYGPAPYSVSRRLRAGLLLLLGACGDPHALSVSPVPPPDVDPTAGFGGRVRLEGRTDADRALFHLELFHGEREELRREAGELPLALPCVVTLTAMLAAEPPSLTVELAPEGGAPRSFACELPPEFPAAGGGLSSPVLVLAPRDWPDDARVPLFGVRRGGRISFTGPEGPFDSDEIVLRVVLELRRGRG